MSPRPVYSFVATSRNDDHGGDILRRTQSWVTRLAQQCERHQVPCELVLVDWNPPKSRASLADVVAWPAGSEWFSARVIVVPSRLHRELRGSSRLSMFQMIAKNVGIRNALGDFIIATNVDIIFSDELFHWLKTGNPRAGRLYRSDRWDIPNEVQLEADLDVLLGRARQDAIRRNLRDGTYIRREDAFVNSTPAQFETEFYEPLVAELRQLERSFNGESETGDARQKLTALFSRMAVWRDNYYLPVLHTNGCGDFTLMSREDWFLLRGYPEWQIFSWAIDSILIFQAHYNGIAVEELPPQMVHYHIEHDYGSGWTPEGSSSLWHRLDQSGIPYITRPTFIDIARELMTNGSEGRFTVYNDLKWGFFEREVETRTLVEPGTPARPPLSRNEGALQEVEDLVPVLRFALQDAHCVGAPLARSELHRAADGDECLEVETNPEPWSSSLTFELPPAARQLKDVSLCVELQVERGVVYVALLNSDRTDFLIQLPCRSSTLGYQQAQVFIKEMNAASQVIFRNGNQDGTAARFRLRSIQLQAERDHPAASSEAAARLVSNNEKGGAAETALPEAGGRETSRSGFELRDLRRGSSNALVSLLSSATDSRQVQAVVILPGQAEAVLDMPGTGTSGGRLAISFHVIEGEIGFELVSQSTGKPLSEHRAPAGLPLTRIELDLSAHEEIAGLVVRNCIPSGCSKVIVHTLDHSLPA